jgi:hypothetical protein
MVKSIKACDPLPHVVAAMCSPCPKVRPCVKCGHEEPIPEEIDWCHSCIESE